MATLDDSDRLWPRFLRISCAGGSSLAILDEFRRPAFSFRLGREAAIAALHPEGLGIALDLADAFATRRVRVAENGSIEVRSLRETVVRAGDTRIVLRCDQRAVTVRLPNGSEIARRVRNLLVRPCAGDCAGAHGDTAF